MQPGETATGVLNNTAEQLAADYHGSVAATVQMQMSANCSIHAAVISCSAFTRCNSRWRQGICITSTQMKLADFTTTATLQAGCYDLQFY